MIEYNLTAYLISLGISVLCACVFFSFSLRKQQALSTGRAASAGACVLILGTVLGLLGAKLFYFIFRFFVIVEIGVGRYWSSLQTEELSFFGGVAGVTLSVFLTAKIFHLPARQTLNSFAAAGALIAAAARFAEYFLFPTGLGDILENPLPFPLAVNVFYGEDYSESMLAVFMFEGIASLIACVLSVVHRDEPRRFLRTLFYICLPQIILESLRTDTIDILLLHVEQLVCYLFVQGVLIWYGFKCGKRRFASWIPALVGLVVCGLTIAEEFMLEGKILLNGEPVPRLLTYSVMAVGLIALAVVEHIGNRHLSAQS